MRIVEIVLSELSSDVLKSEEKLQRLINNNDVDVETNVKEIKSTLKEITNLQIMIEKWKSYTSTTNGDIENNDNNNN
jgi:flagellar motor switch protein FliM